MAAELLRAENEWEELMVRRNAATEEMSETKVDEVSLRNLLSLFKLEKSPLTLQTAVEQIRGEAGDEGDVLEARGSSTTDLPCHAPTMVLARTSNTDKAALFLHLVFL